MVAIVTAGSDNLTPEQLAILNALVTFAAEHIPGGLSVDERKVARIVGKWALGRPPPTRVDEWPKYRMIINGTPKWLPIKKAGIIYDDSWRPVSIGGQVMEQNGTLRDITPAERAKIVDIAEEWSSNK